jgi:hypothetical protein
MYLLSVTMTCSLKPSRQTADVPAVRCPRPVKQFSLELCFSGASFLWTASVPGARMGPQLNTSSETCSLGASESLPRSRERPSRSKPMSSPRLAIPESARQQSNYRQEPSGNRNNRSLPTSNSKRLLISLMSCGNQRGCPEGSPEEDWNRAEQLLQTTRTQSALGSR